MVDGKVRVCLEATPRQIEIWRAVLRVYMRRGGPAWECAQEWESDPELTPGAPYRGDEVEATGDLLETAIQEGLAGVWD